MEEEEENVELEMKEGQVQWEVEKERKEGMVEMVEELKK